MVQTTGTIVFDELPDDQREWLENLDTDFYVHFVEVLDGDWSEQYDIAPSLISPEEILTTNYDSHFVAASTDMPADWIATMDNRRERTKPYWGGQIVWRPVGE